MKLIIKFIIQKARERPTFASSERWDLSGFGSDVVDDWILEPGDSKKKIQTQSEHN